MFDYDLDGVGWSRARIADDRLCAELTASYLSDALKQLIEAVAECVEGAPTARCSWDEEPGEYRFLLERRGDEVRLRVLWFAELWGGRPDESGHVVFETSQSVIHVGLAILSAAQRVLEKWGVAGYQDAWHLAPFPVESFERLRRSVDEAATGAP